MWDQIIHKWLRVPYTLHITVDRKVKKPRATVVFLHGIGNSGSSWEEVIARLPDDIRIITIDLLGFGQSPKPHWPIYDVHLQSRMFIATVLRLRMKGPIILVGHSLGALVSVDIAKKYPRLVSSMILCSPPFYKQNAVTKRLIPNIENVLKDIYKAIQKYPDQFIRISQIAVKYGLINKGFSITKEDAHSYMGALEASIINQTSLQDAINLRRTPMQIIHGTLDAVVIAKNLKFLVKHNANAALTTVIAGHEVKALYVPAVVKAVGVAIDIKNGPSKRSEHAQV
jgi:pimeloyl-ACP methyl ester carboxylesterase